MEDILANSSTGTSNGATTPPPSSSAPAPIAASVSMDTPPVTPVPSPSLNPLPSSPYAAQKFDILRDVNWTETLLLGLFGTAFAYVIIYYRFKLKEDKIINSDIQRQLDNQNMRVGKIETGLSHARIAY